MDEIIINDLSHSFDSTEGQLDVLRKVSFSVRRGEQVVVLGPSGCGKTCLLRCIAGLLTPVSGAISIAGESPVEALQRKDIGFAFQDPALLDWLTVEQNILLPTQVGSATSDTTPTKDKLEELLTLTRLAQFRRYYPSQLSGGMKQRVSLARALILQPKVLLLDEPFGALDLLTRTKLSIELSRILAEAKVATILVSHSVEEGVFLASRVLVMSARPARILEEVSSPFPAPRTESLLEDPKFLQLVSHCRMLLMREEIVS